MPFDPGILRVSVQFARRIKDGDWFGKKDVFVRLQLGSQQARTRTVHSSGAGPEWNESFEFQVDNETELLAVIMHDTGGKDPKELGTAMVALSTVQTRLKDHVHAPVLLPKSTKQKGTLSLVLEYQPKVAARATTDSDAAGQTSVLNNTLDTAPPAAQHPLPPKYATATLPFPNAQSAQPALPPPRAAAMQPGYQGPAQQAPPAAPAVAGTPVLTHTNTYPSYHGPPQHQQWQQQQQFSTQQYPFKQPNGAWSDPASHHAQHHADTASAAAYQKCQSCPSAVHGGNVDASAALAARVDDDGDEGRSTPTPSAPPMPPGEPSFAFIAAPTATRTQQAPAQQQEQQQQQGQQGQQHPEAQHYFTASQDFFRPKASMVEQALQQQQWSTQQYAFAQRADPAAAANGAMPHRPYSTPTGHGDALMQAALLGQATGDRGLAVHDEFKISRGYSSMGPAVTCTPAAASVAAAVASIADGVGRACLDGDLCGGDLDGDGIGSDDGCSEGGGSFGCADTACDLPPGDHIVGLDDFNSLGDSRNRAVGASAATVGGIPGGPMGAAMAALGAVAPGGPTPYATAVMPFFATALSVGRSGGEELLEAAASVFEGLHDV